MSDATAAETVEPGEETGAGVVEPSPEVGTAESALLIRQPWYRSTLGAVVLAVDLLLLVVLAVVSTGLLDAAVDSTAVEGFNENAAIPGYVYVFAALGALGYVFTGLVTDFRRETADLLRMNLRIPAALPLAAGLFLLAGQFLGDSPPTRLLAGIAFLAGLFVNLAYERIGALAKRLLPAEEGEDEQADSGTDGQAAAAGTSDDGQTGGAPSTDGQNGDSSTGGHADGDSLTDELVGSGSSSDSS